VTLAVVVSDTSPIRALAHLGLVELLRDLFGDVLVPPAVETELRASSAGLLVVDLGQFPFIRVQAPLDQAQGIQDFRTGSFVPTGSFRRFSPFARTELLARYNESASDRNAGRATRL
jgi:hypothetical protein